MQPHLCSVVYRSLDLNIRHKAHNDAKTEMSYQNIVFYSLVFNSEIIIFIELNQYHVLSKISIYNRNRLLSVRFYGYAPQSHIYSKIRTLCGVICSKPSLWLMPNSSLLLCRKLAVAGTSTCGRIKGISKMMNHVFPSVIRSFQMALL